MVYKSQMFLTSYYKVDVSVTKTQSKKLDGNHLRDNCVSLLHHSLPLNPSSHLFSFYFRK